MNERKYFVANDNGDIAGHDLDYQTAQQVLEEMERTNPGEGWEIITSNDENVMLYVTLINGDNEDVILKTTKENEAINRAKDEAYYIARDKRIGERVEIRKYLENIENEDCNNFDYDLIEF